MIPKKNRFHGHHALDSTYKHGKTLRSELMNLKFAPTKNDQYRLSVVVSKKVSKSAVVRNRIRRRLYEAMRIVDKEGSLPQKDIILTVFDESVATMGAKELQQTINKLVTKIN